MSPPDAWETGAEAFLLALGRALDAGLPGLLLRFPGCEDGAFVRFGERVAELFAKQPVAPWFALHDRPHLVEELGANAVHLGHRSLPPERVREAFGDAIGIGVSLHGGDDPPDRGVVDYAFLGPLRPSPSKPQDSAAQRKPLAASAWRHACERIELPVLALGGVTPADVRTLRGRGVYGVAAISALWGCEDAGRATGMFLAELGEGEP